MEPKVSYVLVGAFVAVFGAVLILLVLWLARGGPQKTYRSYYTYFNDSVSGVSEDSVVKYKGINVGRVKNMRFDPDNPERVRLVLDIAEGTPIKQDTFASLAPQGLTGLAFVELGGGTRDSPPLTPSPGQLYPVIKIKSSLPLDQAASALMTSLNEIAASLKDLTDKGSRDSIRKTLVNLAELTGALIQREKALDKLFLSTGGTLENTQEATAKLPALIARVTETAAALETMAQQFARTGKSVDSLVAGSQQDVHQSLAQADLLIAETRQLTERLQRLTQQVEQNPRSLLFGRRAEPGPGE